MFLDVNMLMRQHKVYRKMNYKFEKKNKKNKVFFDKKYVLSREHRDQTENGFSYIFFNLPVDNPIKEI